MGIEDQKEEREVLESIFPEEITGARGRPLHQQFRANSISAADVSETEFRVLIKLDVGEPSYDEDEDDEDTSRSPAHSQCKPLSNSI